MNKKALISGSIFGFLTVLIGAFGAHALKPILLQYGTSDTFETAIKYQAYHALTLLIIGILSQKIKSRWLDFSVISFMAGIFVFSYSLILLSILNLSYLGAITPIGGMLLLAGWAFLLLAIIKQK